MDTYGKSCPCVHTHTYNHTKTTIHLSITVQTLIRLNPYTHTQTTTNRYEHALSDTPSGTYTYIYIHDYKQTSKTPIYGSVLVVKALKLVIYLLCMLQMMSVNTPFHVFPFHLCTKWNNISNHRNRRNHIDHLSVYVIFTMEYCWWPTPSKF